MSNRKKLPPDFIFTRQMVESWQHSAGCVVGDPGKCSCGLTALQALVVRKAPRRPFTLHVGDAAYAAR